MDRLHYCPSVPQYIRNEARRFQTFGANRLSINQDATSPSQWHHVDSQTNPADNASTGFLITETNKMECWCSGPAFLYKQERQWPRQPEQIPDLSEEKCELKSRKLQVYAIVQEDCMQTLLLRFWFLAKLQKPVTWLLCFKEYLRNKN